MKRNRNYNYGTCLLAGMPQTIQGLQFSEFDGKIIMPLYELTDTQIAKLELSGYTVIDKARYISKFEKYDAALAVIFEAVKKKTVYTLHLIQTGYKFKKAVAKKIKLTTRPRGKVVCFDKSHVLDVCTTLGVMISEITFR